jgi:hypothetical protein
MSLAWGVIRVVKSDGQKDYGRRQNFRKQSFGLRDWPGRVEEGAQDKFLQRVAASRCDARTAQRSLPTEMKNFVLRPGRGDGAFCV